MSNPMYRQIAEDLRAQIESGKLRPGQQLRTELELREHYGASRNTVRDAIKWLITLGLVETRPGQGTFVTEKVDPFVTTLSGDPESGVGGDEGASYRSEVTQRSRKPSIGTVQVEILHATGEVAAQLRIPEGAEVISRHQRRYIDGTAWSLQTSFYPAELADRGAERLRRAATIPAGDGAVHAGVPRDQAGRVSGLDHRAGTQPDRSGLLQAACRRPGPDLRDSQDRLRPGGQPRAAHGHHVPG
jgi:hypothetical protein